MFYSFIQQGKNICMLLRDNSTSKTYLLYAQLQSIARKFYKRRGEQQEGGYFVSEFKIEVFLFPTSLIIYGTSQTDFTA